jgi:predicted O-methyltransferase YrrM
MLIGFQGRTRRIARKTLMRLANRLYRTCFLRQSSKRVQAAIAEATRYGATGGWALSRNAMEALARELASIPAPRICEFGAGVSTVFFSSFLEPPGQIDSFESNSEYFDRVQRHIDPARVRLELRPLRVLSDRERDALMRGGEEPDAFARMGRIARADELDNPRLPNAFYDLERLEGTYDALVLDGPNGNGRSLAFPLLRSRLRPGALILIDDCTHYPFLADCGRFFSFDLIAGEIHGHDSWVLIRVRPDPATEFATPGSGR